MSTPKNTQTSTPTPWTIEATPSRIEVRTDPMHVYAFSHADRGNAEFIVRAVNAHEHLVGALESVAQAFAVEHIAEVIPPSVAAKVKAALRAARGES